jgi:hypothetical protein
VSWLYDCFSFSYRFGKPIDRLKTLNLMCQKSCDFLRVGSVEGSMEATKQEEGQSRTPTRGVNKIDGNCSIKWIRDMDGKQILQQ